MNQLLQAARRNFPGAAAALGIAAAAMLLTGLAMSDWQWSAALARQTIYAGMISGLLYWGNGIIAEGVPISWTQRPQLRFWVSLLLTLSVSFAIILLCDLIFYLQYHGQWPEQLINPRDTPRYLSVLGITVVVSIFLHARSFLYEMRQAIEEREALKRAHLSSKFENLQNQVNPHFLFNSLNVLSNLVYKDADQAAHFIRQLSKVYRYVLDVKDREVIYLAEELAALEAYLHLLQIRFGGSFRIQLELKPRTGEVIVPLALQMLVENAIKHNIVSQARPLTVTISRSEEGSICVSNNLQARNSQQESLGIGLDNIRQRYQFLSHDAIRIDSGNGHFTVLLPSLSIATSDADPDR